MNKKAWLVMDGRYQSNPDDATVLEAYIEQPQPTWAQLSNDWGGTITLELAKEWNQRA